MLANDFKCILKEHTKFLGVSIDDTLKWVHHIEITENKLNSVCYTLQVLSKYLDFKAIKIIYH